MPTKKDLTGLRFGRLVVLNQYDRTKNFKYRWICQCDCGNIVVVLGASMICGRQVSCGCYCNEVHSKRLTTHSATTGGKWTREYRAWHAMKQRCYNPKNKDYPNYGGRSIAVCDGWKDSFATFLEDMGECPKGLTLDRKDCNGNYEPNNCKWSTWTEQARNQRRVKWITINNSTHCLSEWALISGLAYSCLKHRVQRGWPVERLLDPSGAR